MTTTLMGAFGFAPQSAKGVVGTLGDTVWHRGHTISMAVVEFTRMYDAEVGGTLLPGGGFKAGYALAGEIEITPRLDANIGWLLYAFAGRVSTSGDAGVGYTHKFPGAVLDNEVPNKWITIRRVIPADEDADYLGEVFQDCKVTAVAIVVGAGNTLRMRLSFEGLTLGTPVLNPYDNGWTVENEDFDTVPVAMEGSFTHSDGSTITNASNVTVGASLNVPDPQRELVVGSYSPRAITVLGRTVTASCTFFYDDPDMYRKIVYGAVDGVTWTPEIWEGGGDFELIFKTPGTPVGTGDDVQGEIGFSATRMFWTQRPLDLEAGSIMMYQQVGTVVDSSDDGNGDWTLWIKNDKATYTWPTGDSSAPTKSSAEVGLVNSSTVEITFSENIVSASNMYSKGFTVKVNSANNDVLGGARQGLNKIRLAITTPVTNGQTVTFSYVSTTGDIKDEAGNAFASVTDSGVTNNVSA
jgi:hypothetical protein